MYKVPKATTGSVGAFKWTYGSNEVKTIRMRSTATLLPTFVSRTVNLGDPVSLVVTKKSTLDKQSKSKWRKNGGNPMRLNNLQFDISIASTNDSGIYECHYRHERDLGNQALIRLIVRGCPQNNYGPPACSSECPKCLNGGVCDDVGGDCICPPGFSGELCENIKGPNRFGQEGSLHCDSVGLPSRGSTCKGMLFCLPDPYGCSCAAGYQGLECKTDCDDGTYGANCAQICHCAEGVSCNGTTGRCDGNCAAGYKGVNCQVQCTSGQFGKNCNQNCHCAVASCDGTTGQCDGDCASGYTGDNCQVCIDGNFGVNCAQNCHCADGASCDGTTGECDGDCAAGYQGDSCQVQCAFGQFGLNCNQTCHCADASCNGTTGQCVGDCAAGYKGDNCQDCIDGKFGADCAQTCHCADSVSCDGTTGQCSGSCAAGYTGNICQELCLPYGDNNLSCSTTCTILDPNRIPRRLSVSSYSAGDSFTNKLSWEPVICPPNGIDIVNYVYDVLGDHESDVKPVAVEGTSVNLHLAHCTSYQFKVAAQTSQGIGNYGIVSYTTKSTVPNPVASVTVSATSHNQLTVSWDIPLADNQSPCPATEYLVTYDLIQLEQCKVASRGIETLTTTNTTITINRLEAYSTYWVTVTSKNQAGSSTPVSRTMTTTQSIPEAPTVTVASASTDHIEFAWELPCGRTGGNITEYRYKYKADNDFIQPITTTDKRIRITSLTPCTSYVFQVRAFNSIGRGPWSNETRQKTTQKEPLGVKNLSVEPDSQGILVASWEDRGVGHKNKPCLASSYYVTYELINLDQCGEGDQSGGSLNTTDTITTVEGLHPYSTYRINVTSRNEAGDGPTKSKSAITTERSLGIAPTFNSSRVTYNTISITWNPIPCGSRGVRITGYGVSLSRQDGQSKRDNLKQVPTTSVSAQFDQLSPCTAYIITVTTIQLRGEGTSFSREIETDTTVPGVVTGLTISRIQHDRLRVSWTAPPGTNPDTPCLATDYLVTYELINLEQCQVVNDAGVSSLNTTDTSVIIEGLKAYSKYRVYVTPRNEAGNGTATTRSKITGEKGPQAAPSFNRSEVTASSISITWNPIPCGSRGGSITGYISKLFLLRGNAQSQYDVIGESTSVQFDELSPCTNYTIAVTALGASIGTSFEREETTDTVAPGRVTVLRASPTSDATQIHVTWQNPNANDCPVSKYKVEYQLLYRDQCDRDVPQNRKQWFDDSQSPTTITGLYPHSTYRVYVKPSNSAGAGEEASVLVTTNSTAPSGPPRDLKFFDVTNQTIAFSWKLPVCGQRNGLITQYHYRLIDSEGVLDEDTTSSTGTEFTGLVPFMSYKLSVSAENQFASGQVASITTRTQEGIPPPPSKVTFPVTRSNMITVAWNTPSPPHGIIISYEIRYWKTGSGNQTLGDTIRITKQLASQYQTKTIMALDKSVSYSIQVRAETSVGHGPWSYVSTVTTVPKGYTLMPFVLNRDL
ncbi:protein sidekick-2-like [Asterias amurensis]|uniref:protein sidekick-2-like n=1 Tax=Asterias amurensis TaxID=7602 RepID=UPI003AB27CD0